MHQILQIDRSGEVLRFYEHEAGRTRSWEGTMQYANKYTADGRNSKGMERVSIAENETARFEESARRLAASCRVHRLLSSFLLGVLGLNRTINVSW